jgi:Acetyltransferase (GNAT) family
MRPLFAQHFVELGVNQHRLAAIADEPRYAQLEKADILFVITVRADQKLVGYFVGFIMPHLHYMGAGPWAMTDMYFVKPEYRRGAGLKLFRAFKQIARENGCRFAVTSCKVHEDHSALLEKLGAKWTDKTFIFALEDKACQ